MNAPFWSTRPVYIEIGQCELKILDQNRGLDLPLERQANGRLTDACMAALTTEIKRFLGQQPWRWNRQAALCAVGARGISLRRLNLPASSEAELRQVLTLQLESEFPLPPDELAWGYCFANDGVSPVKAHGTRDVLVAAIKREALQQYAGLLAQCGLAPVFTLAALARTAVLAQATGNYAVLDVTHKPAELALFEGGLMTATRVVPWGSDPPGPTADLGPLASFLTGQQLGQKLFFIAKDGNSQPFAKQLSETLGAALSIEPVEFPATPGRSAATMGLERLWARHEGALPLSLRLKEETVEQTSTASASWKWAAALALLLLVSFVLRYGPPLVGKASLGRRVAQLRSELKALPRIDRDLSFLEYLETNQPPFLDALYQIASAAPGGTRLDSVAMSRRGEVSVKGAAGATQQALDLRTKLVESGFFSTVVLDEQTPSPDRQKATFRLTAQIKPPGERPVRSPEPANKPAKDDRSGAAIPGNKPPRPGGTNQAPSAPLNAQSKTPTS